MVNAFKVNFIKFLSSLQGLPKDQQQQFDRIIARLKQPDIAISKEDERMASVLIAALFCGVNVPNFPMSDDNKTLVASYSKNHLTAPKTKVRPKKSG